jgi:hypothetical protein
MKDTGKLRILCLGIAIIAYLSACIWALLPFARDSGSGYLPNLIYGMVGRLGILIAFTVFITLSVFVALWFIQRKEGTDTTDKCEFCSKPLGSSTPSHMVKEHRVCLECYEKIEEEKLQEEFSPQNDEGQAKKKTND